MSASSCAVYFAGCPPKAGMTDTGFFIYHFETKPKNLLLQDMRSLTFVRDDKGDSPPRNDGIKNKLWNDIKDHANKFSTLYIMK